VVSTDLRAGVYQDTDHTTVGTGIVSVRARPTTEWTLGARYLVDVTTSASIDVVSAATDRWDEARHETAGELAWTDGSTALSASYVHSLENDWESHSGRASFAQDLDGHDVTFGIGAAFVVDDIWRASDRVFSREQIGLSATASITGVASPREIWSLAYTLTYADGYQASPYRFARVRSSVQGPLLLHVPERHPEERTRHALAIRSNVMLGDRAALRSHMRIYLDDWGVGSITLGTELRAETGAGVELGASVRAYAQLGAAFYRDVYDAPQRYVTSDRELSPFADLFVGPRIAWRGDDEGPFRALRFELELMGFGFWFFDFARLASRYGVTAQLAFGGDL
jgi:hypothetical protein